MAPDSLNPIFRRIREKVPYRRSVSLTDEDIERLSYLEKAFTTIYTDEVPFSFSKTVSKAIDLANLMVLDPKLLLEEEQYYEKVRRLFPPTFRRIREKAPHVRSLSLTDEDIQRLSYFEKIFTEIYSVEVPFSFSKTVSKAVELATLMVGNPRLFNQDQECIQEFSEELKEQLKYEIESGTLYKLNVLFRLNVLSYELYSRLATQETLTDEDWRHLRDFQEKDGLSGFKDVIDYSLKIRLLKNLS